MLPPTANAKVVAFASSDSHDVMPIVGPDLCLNTSMRSCISVKYDSSATNTIVSLPGSYSRNAPTQRTTNYATSGKTGSTSAETVRLAHSSAHTVQSLVRPAHFDKILKATAKKRQQRTDSTSSIPPPSTHHPPPTNTLPGTARWGGSLLQNCANNKMLPPEVQTFTRFPHTGPHEVNTHLPSTKDDTSDGKRQSCGLRKFR